MTEAKATTLDAGAPVGQTSTDCYDAVTPPSEDPASPRPERGRQPGSTRPMNTAPSRSAAQTFGLWVRARATVIAAIATTFLAIFAAGSLVMEAFRGFEERIYARMDQRFEAMEQRFEAMDQRFEAMDQRFEALEADLETFKTEVRRELDSLNENVSALRESVSALREEVALIRGVVVGLDPPADRVSSPEPEP